MDRKIADYKQLVIKGVQSLNETLYLVSISLQANILVLRKMNINNTLILNL